MLWSITELFGHPLCAKPRWVAVGTAAAIRSANRDLATICRLFAASVRSQLIFNTQRNVVHQTTTDTMGFQLCVTQHGTPTKLKNPINGSRAGPMYPYRCRPAHQMRHKLV